MKSADEGVELSISELAELMHTSKSALRYYEKEGLVTPERASTSGYRRYSLQSLIELSDVILYRGLGVPVKDVRRLLDSPIEQTSIELDRAEDELLGQIREAAAALERIASRRKRIRVFFEARYTGQQFVEKPGIERLFPFSVGSAEGMHAYLGDPDNVHYAAYFPCATQPTHYIDCAMQPCTDESEDIVWSYVPSDAKTRWLQCLLRTDYSFTGSNNLDEHVKYLQELGYEPGEVIAEYLTFDWDKTASKRVDYYRAWIEARS